MFYHFDHLQISSRPLFYVLLAGDSPLAVACVPLPCPVFWSALSRSGPVPGPALSPPPHIWPQLFPRGALGELRATVSPSGPSGRSQEGPVLGSAAPTPQTPPMPGQVCVSFQDRAVNTALGRPLGGSGQFPTHGGGRASRPRGLGPGVPSGSQGLLGGSGGQVGHPHGPGRQVTGPVKVGDRESLGSVL